MPRLQSRRHEYEADQLALSLALAGAGLSREATLQGAAATMRMFMRMEGAGGAAAPDDLLSTHPAATNRLRAVGLAAAAAT